MNLLFPPILVEVWSERPTCIWVSRSHFHYFSTFTLPTPPWYSPSPTTRALAHQLEQLFARLPAQTRLDLAMAGQPYDLSAFDYFTTAINMFEDLTTSNKPQPPDHPLPTLSGLSVATGPASKQITIAWNPNALPDDYYLYVAYRPMVPNIEAYALSLLQELTTKVGQVYSTIVTLPEPASWYALFISIQNTATDQYSESDALMMLSAA